MQPPIPLETTLQNRYRLISILGQGGFGRTYLAEDTGRFNELCALKEFIPVQKNTEAVQKSQELFSREAAILYQIQHPQIPQFRATFEENQRLFLLQDYVEGKTYRTILQERQPTGNLFSEAEVITFLRQMLPVLAHIHNCGIIHRDISPDNIIRRESDKMPVLIDFGVVKELATRVQSPDLAIPMTNVGKFGYAPWEQIQLGRATASSDLYALAVTTVILLTGKEPQQLIDQTTLTWNWQRWVAVSPGLAEIINKMLSRQPGDRYQSVTELGKALETIPDSQRQQVSSTINQAEEQKNQPQSQQPTVYGNQDQNPEPNQYQSFFAKNQWAATALVTVLVVLCGVGSWSVVNLILKRRQPASQLEQPTQINPIPIPELTPTPTQSPSASPSPSPKATLSPSPMIPSPPPGDEIPLTPLPTDANSPIPDIPAVSPPPTVFSEENLNVSPGEPISIEGDLKGNETIGYIISGGRGQNLNLLVTGEGVLMTIISPDGEPVDAVSEKVSIWKGILPTDGNYQVQLTPLPGLPGTDYKLDINLINPTPAPTFVPRPIPEATTTPNPQPIEESPPTATPTPTPEATESPTATPTPTPEATESPTATPTPTPEATELPESGATEESPSDLLLNKPSQKETTPPSPTSTTPLEELDKPPKQETATLETTETPSPSPAEETTPEPQMLVE
ncbi:MAG: serine/threonine-protein kinase [Microcoleaceae cyanobacterium MO_207.B10]|nr:serine/threonine-protein kinase [Microcoleaceae cyanobacterium MO_207.B10]